MSFDFENTQLNEPNEDVVLKPSYISQNGFVRTKVFRGFSEISVIFDDVSYVGGLICGGYVRYMCSPATTIAPATDLDIYFQDEKQYDLFKNVIENKYGLGIRHENEISVTYNKTTDVEHPLYGCPIIQIIKPMKEGAIVSVGDIETILSNFDFTVIRAGLISPKEAMVDADFMHDEEHHILRIKNIHCPISSTLRCMKYSRKGYWLPPMQVVRLLVDWMNRNEEYRDKIVDYLEKANGGTGLTKEEIEELEALMRID